MEITFASSNEAEVRVYPNQGRILTFRVDENANVLRFLRKVADRDDYRTRLDERMPFINNEHFKEARRLAVEAIEIKRLIERSHLKVLEADMDKRIICVDTSWDGKFAQITFGAGRENLLYLKSCEGSFVPQGLCDYARELAEKQFADAIADTSYLPLLAHAVARKT